MNQHEWVAGCQNYYSENWLEPGNPEDGEWHDCHYPTPKCLGGTDTVKLLKEHHAVQGVLQSEEWQHPCIFGWEKTHLTGDLLLLYCKWVAKKGFLTYTSAERSTLARKRNEAQTPEQRSERQYRAAKTRRRNGRRSGAATPEVLQRMKEESSDRARKMHAARPPEERSAIARKGHETRTPEERSAIARKGHETRKRRQEGRAD